MAGEEVAVIPSVAESAAGGGTEVVETIESTEEVPAGGAAETTETETELADGERAPGDTSTDEHPEREDIDTDGRKIDARTKEAIKKLAATDPEAAKAVRDAYFSKQSMMKEFPEAKNFSEVIRDVRTMKATLEAVGGEPGIHELTSKVADYDTEVAQFAKGDRALIEQLHAENPQGVMLAARNSLELLGEKSPALLEQAMLPSFVSLAQKAGVGKYFAEAMQACTEGNGQLAFDKIKDVQTWLTGLEKKAGEMKTQATTVDPKTQELNDRETAVKRKEEEAYDREINNHVTKLNNDAMSKITGSLFKEVGLDAKDRGPGRRDFIQGLMNRVFAEMRKDATYMRLAKNLKSKGDAEHTAQFAHDKFSELLPDVFEKFKNDRFPNLPSKKAGGGKPAAAASAANGAGGGKAAPAAAASTASVVTKIPAPDTIDWTKTTEAMYHVGRGWGEAILLPQYGGKRQKWLWETATN